MRRRRSPSPAAAVRKTSSELASGTLPTRCTPSGRTEERLSPAVTVRVLVAISSSSPSLRDAARGRPLLDVGQQRVDAIARLPWRVDVGAAEVPVCGGGREDRPPQIELADDRAR